MFKAIIDNPKVMLLSHTVFPEVDNVATLKAYAIEKELDDKSGT
jgi:protein SCO1/2